VSVLPDVLAPRLAVVFCGTAAGLASARRKAYYAGPGNAFWPTLQEIGLTPDRLAPEAFRSVAALGIGLTDLAKHVAGADSTLSAGHFDRAALRARILRHAPSYLAFTSKRAAAEFLGRDVAYGPQPERVGATALFVLPSPSGRARRYWDIAPWRELARLVDATRTPT
jgi:double-stranded uracil-DNA glycosylase